jgi:hypothetical protein
MANKTINQYTQLGTTPAATDDFLLWDADAAATKRVAYSNLMPATITGGGTIATGGFTLTVPATGTAFIATGIAGGQTANGGTAASEDLTLESTAHSTKGNIVTTSSFRSGYDTNLTSYFGRAAIGFMGVSDEASFAHIDYNSSTDYSLKQTVSGWTLLNVPTGATMSFRINNAAIMNMNATGLGIGGTAATQQLEVDSGGIRAGYDGDYTSYFGRAAVGFMGLSDTASFAHIDFNNSTDYALKQSVSGWTLLNIPTGAKMNFRINDVDSMTMNATGLGIGGDAASQKLEVTASGIRAGYDGDYTSYFGRAAVGFAVTTDYATFAHIDHQTVGGRALYQDSGGTTVLNAASGQNVYFRINNATIGQIAGSTISFTGDASINQNDVSGAVQTLQLFQLDDSEEFINYTASIGAGDPIDTAALGSYYGKIRVSVNGTFKYMALYDS